MRPKQEKPKAADLLAGKSRELADLRAAAIKYPKLTSLLSTAVKGLAPDTKMPAVRDLARHLGVSLVTTQRALRGLIDEGLLYSKSRSGIFVGRGEPHPQASRHPFLASFDFGTDSGAPYQRKFWEELAELFRKQHPNLSAVLHFETGKALRDRLLDVYEGYNWNKRSPIEDTLDIAGFAGSLLPASAVHNRLLPLYYRTHFLFYNRTLLALHGLPEPAYRTFAGQADYLQSLAPELSRLGFDPRPYSIQEPVTVYGGWISDLAALFDGTNSLPSRELLEATGKVLGFCRMCRYSVKESSGWVDARDAFVNGQVPFFLGYSVDHWEFSENRMPFSLEAYPTLCSDDTLFLLPRFGVINRRSEHPVESLSFLLFLLRPEIQKHFAATGNFGVSRGKNLHPATAADPRWVSDVLRKSPPFDLTTKERHYVISSILGGELWRALMENASAEQVLERAIHLQRGYLQLRPEKERTL